METRLCREHVRCVLVHGALPRKKNGSGTGRATTHSGVVSKRRPSFTCNLTAPVPIRDWTRLRCTIGAGSLAVGRPRICSTLGLHLVRATRFWPVVASWEKPRLCMYRLCIRKKKHGVKCVMSVVSLVDDVRPSAAETVWNLLRLKRGGSTYPSLLISATCHPPRHCFESIAHAGK